VGIGLVALLVFDWIVSLIMTPRLRSEANEAFAPVRPPRQAIMCDSGPTPACAAKAARKAQSTVAWMPAPTGYQLCWLVAVRGEGRRSLAFEYLVSDSLTLELESDPDPTHPLDYNAHIGATVWAIFLILPRIVPSRSARDPFLPTNLPGALAVSAR
jgi:hypothetical protein